MIISEVLDAIDNINSITIESEIDTCKSLLSSYDKMSLLEEYYEGDDINGFKIFQEAQTESPKKNQGIFRTIINAIKTLFKAIAQWFQNIFNPQKVKQAEDNVKKCKKLGKKERAAIFGALGLATVASVAAVNHHKKKGDNEDNTQPEPDKKTDEVADDEDIKDNEQQEADKKTDEEQNNKLQLGKTDEQLKKALEKSNKKCMEYRKRLEEALRLEQEFNKSVEAKNPFKKDEFECKKNVSEVKKYPCIKYDSKTDKVCFTYNIEFLIDIIKDLNMTTKRAIKFFTYIIESINKNESFSDEYINKLREKIDGFSESKSNKIFNTPYWSTKESISNPSKIYLTERAYSSDPDQIYDLEELIENFKQKIPVDEFNTVTRNYNDILNKITDDKFFDVICKNDRLLNEFKSLTSYYERRKKIIEMFLSLLNEAIAQYNLIINKMSGNKQFINKQFISDMNYKMSGNENKNAKIKAKNASDAMEQAREDKKNEEKDKKNKEQNELLANMRAEFAKFVGETGYKNKQQKKSVKKKREELLEEYKKKGLVVDDNVNYDELFGKPEDYAETE